VTVLFALLMFSLLTCIVIVRPRVGTDICGEIPVVDTTGCSVSITLLSVVTVRPSIICRIEQQRKNQCYQSLMVLSMLTVKIEVIIRTVRKCAQSSYTCPGWSRRIIVSLR